MSHFAFLDARCPGWDAMENGNMVCAMQVAAFHHANRRFPSAHARNHDERPLGLWLARQRQRRLAGQEQEQLGTNYDMQVRHIVRILDETVASPDNEVDVEALLRAYVAQLRDRRRGADHVDPSG